MDLQDNPYMNLLEIMQKQGQPRETPLFMLGTLVSISPLLIQAGGVQLEREDLLINTSLSNSFQIGEKVVLLVSPDQQQFILICKVR